MSPANPFPDIECQCQAIIRMSYAGFSILIMVLLMVLMVYFYTRHTYKYFLPILTVFLFSLVIGMLSISSLGIPYTPWFQLFFILLQSVFFIINSLEFFKN